MKKIIQLIFIYFFIGAGILSADDLKKEKSEIPGEKKIIKDSPTFSVGKSVPVTGVKGNYEDSLDKSMEYNNKSSIFMEEKILPPPAPSSAAPQIPESALSDTETKLNLIKNIEEFIKNSDYDTSLILSEEYLKLNHSDSDIYYEYALIKYYQSAIMLNKKEIADTTMKLYYSKFPKGVFKSEFKKLMELDAGK